MWHKLEKSIFLIFRSEIPHNELTNGLCSFCSALLLFARKFTKTVQDANRYKMGDISALSNNTITSLLKCAKASSLFFKYCTCVESIGKFLKPKTRIFSLILNSRHVFKNYQYFLVLKSNFGACFQDMFYLCGITPKDLRLRL